MKDLLVLRADHYSRASHQTLIEADRTGRFEIVVVADRRKRHFEYSGFRHVAFDTRTVRSLGLPTRRDMQWRCGDYAYYLAAQAVPDFRHLWLLETDLRIGFDRLEDFFRLFDDCPADFLASDLRPADLGWSWRVHVAALRQEAYRCFFPLTRVSRAACTHLRHQRAASTDALANDESFAATILVNDGYDCRELEAVVPGLYARPGFSFDYPVLDRAYERAPRDNRIYHPVLRDRLYLKRLRRYHGFPKAWRTIYHEACTAYGWQPPVLAQRLPPVGLTLGAALTLLVVILFDNPEAIESLMQAVAVLMCVAAAALALRSTGNDDGGTRNRVDR
ncbi:hypothetical protein EC845_3656 [Comamonas sp. BIGb0124]|uniref:hypothetical protein n=1 Tax=Comamonas sp. BIGb0124 TaxID=2485130 RepID=UPI000FAE823E|nr:hypothetical protein [Comamonas sp. BIGb0124]ROR18680.1 hypothetical protein EC845_3656 [Comamonas sp. BIGb0124]